ncbi:MipA/OmpV family protein [Achromobacter xylosoxidans]
MNHAVPRPIHRRSHVRQYCLALLALSLGADVAAEGRDHTKIGFGVAARPKFEGSDRLQAEPIPLLDIRQGRFFVRAGEGIGANLIESPRATLGVGVSWMQGYKASDVPDGIGKLSGALGGRVFVSTRLSGAVVTLSATQALTKSERGLLVNARVSYPYQMTERLEIIPSISTNWASEKYLNSYFGVDSDRAMRSGFSVYKPSAGFKDVSLRLAVRYEFNKSWSIAGGIGVSRLLDKAADSPFVERKIQPSAAVGLMYTF